MPYSTLNLNRRLSESICVRTITCTFHMFTAIVTCPRRVKVAHTFSLSMRRQLSLGTSPFINAISLYFTRPHLAKFFNMPPGKKARPQQSSLTELWASKPKKQSSAAAPADTSGGDPQVEPQADGHGTADAAGLTTSSEERGLFLLLHDAGSSRRTQICSQPRNRSVNRRR